MKHSILFLLTILFHLTSISQNSAHWGAPKYAPIDGKKLLIVGQDLGAVGGLDNYTEGYVDYADHIPAGVTSYTSLPSLSGLENQANWGSGDVRAQSYLEDTTFQNSFIVIGLYLVNQLNAIRNGLQDYAIREFATWVKNQEKPVFIRIGYEFEGPWNNYDPDEFIDAWRHIVHVFDEEEVPNAVYVWQSAGLNQNNIADWYPGDSYVNWVGYSYFDGFNMGQSIRAFAETHDKPIMISEATPRRDIKLEPYQNHWQAWYAGLFETIYENDRIKALAYINVDWDSQPMWSGQGWGDSRVQENPYVFEQWNIEIDKDPWIVASDTMIASLTSEEWLTAPFNSLENVLTNKENFSWTNELSKIKVRSKDGILFDGLALYDLQGTCLQYIHENNSQYLIDVAGLPNGIYILSMFVGVNQISEKIFIDN